MNKTTFLFLILINFSFQSTSQTTNDAGLWNTIKINKKFNKKFNIFLLEEYRLKENFSQTNSFFTELGVGYKPFLFLKTSLLYRLSEKFKGDEIFSLRHRLIFNLTLKKRLNDNFLLSYRQRLQSEVRDVYSSPTGTTPNWYYRHKIALKYNLNDALTPYLATEFRYQIYDKNSLESNKLFHRNRYVIGLDYEKSDKHSFGVFYLILKIYYFELTCS